MGIVYIVGIQSDRSLVNIISMPKANFRKVTPRVRHVTWVNRTTSRGTRSRSIYVETTQTPQSSPARSAPSSPTKSASCLEPDVAMLDFTTEHPDDQFESFAHSESKVCVASTYKLLINCVSVPE